MYHIIPRHVHVHSYQYTATFNGYFILGIDARFMSSDLNMTHCSQQQWNCVGISIVCVCACVRVWVSVTLHGLCSFLLSSTCLQFTVGFLVFAFRQPPLSRRWCPWCPWKIRNSRTHRIIRPLLSWVNMQPDFRFVMPNIITYWFSLPFVLFIWQAIGRLLLCLQLIRPFHGVGSDKWPISFSRRLVRQQLMCGYFLEWITNSWDNCRQPIEKFNGLHKLSNVVREDRFQ